MLELSWSFRSEWHWRNNLRLFSTPWSFHLPVQPEQDQSWKDFFLEQKPLFRNSFTLPGQLHARVENFEDKISVFWEASSFVFLSKVLQAWRYLYFLLKSKGKRTFQPERDHEELWRFRKSWARHNSWSYLEIREETALRKAQNKSS